MTKKDTQNDPTKSSLAQELDPNKLTLSKKDILEFVDVILYRGKKNYLANAKYIAGLEMMRIGLIMTGEDTLSKIWSEILNGFNDLLYENAMARARSENPDWVTIREKIKKEVKERVQKYAIDFSYPIKPEKLLVDVRNSLADQDIVISDVGAHKLWIAKTYDTYLPNTCLISNGFASMGFALPGAIAAQLAFPDRKVVAMCGDGGFLCVQYVNRYYEKYVQNAG